MLRSLKDLERCQVMAIDGVVGHVDNFLFDDVHWVIRYLIVETSAVMGGQRVLISPASFHDVDWVSKQFHLALTVHEIQESPGVNADKPAIGQHELDPHGRSQYWGSSWIWGDSDKRGSLANRAWDEAMGTDSSESVNPHLRSADEVRGYYVQGSDEPIGHVEDFIVDDETWAINYLVVNTSNWLFGKRVLVGPRWASSISWNERNVYVAMPRQAIKDSPEWDPAVVIDRQYEERLLKHYGLQPHRDDDERRPRAPSPHASERHE